MSKAQRRLLAGLILGIGVGAWWVYESRPRPRRPGPEGLDDPAVARAFGWVARLPPMRLLRALAVWRATRLASQGEAVDLGCGPGLLVFDLARHAPGLHVTGVDLAEDMLAQGEENARGLGLDEQTAFRLGDAQDIPFADHSLDLVVSTLSLHHWWDPGGVLNEVARVLKPGGAFLILDLRRDVVPPLRLLLRFVTRFIVPGALRRVGEPLGSLNASYTATEAAEMASRSALCGWRLTRGPLWLTIEGTTPES